jgi:predicted HTH transcriptional regulator
MASACRDAGNPEPVFEIKGGREFSVAFPSRAGVAMREKPAVAWKGTANDTVNGTPNDTVNGNGTVNDTPNDAAMDAQGKLLSLLSSNPRITAKEASARMGLSERHVKKTIKALKDSGLVERVGPDKGGHWVVKGQ